MSRIREHWKPAAPAKMCYAIPARVLERDDEEGLVDYGGVRKRVNLSFAEGAKVGDYVLIHAGFAIERLSKKSARESLAIIRRCGRLGEGR